MIGRGRLDGIEKRLDALDMDDRPGCPVCVPHRYVGTTVRVIDGVPHREPLPPSPECQKPGRCEALFKRIVIEHWEPEDEPGPDLSPVDSDRPEIVSV